MAKIYFKPIQIGQPQGLPLHFKYIFFLLQQKINLKFVKNILQLQRVKIQMRYYKNENCIKVPFGDLGAIS